MTLAHPRSSSSPADTLIPPEVVRIDLPQATIDALRLLSPETLTKVAKALRDSVAKEIERSQIWTYYPDEGPLRRELYVKHMEFFSAGLFHQERAFIAANRSGKTHAVCYETALHMLGEYPSWWVGRRFSRPVTCWLSGEDGKAVRESLQEKMLGRYGNFGTGFIPGKALLETRPRLGVPEAIDIFSVRHKPTGGTSRAVFKAYEQGRESFQSAAVDVVVFDEEPPMPIYTEGLTRTLSTWPGEASGMVMCSFTPLLGLSSTVLQYLPGGHLPETIDARKAAWGW